MKTSWVLAAILLLPGGLAAQSVLPAGTLIPIQTKTGLNADKVKMGQEIRATVAQDIPGTQIRKGARVFGTVVSAVPSGKGPAKIELRFDAVEINSQRVPLSASLRALASPIEIEDAQVGDYGPDAGIAWNQETTHQIGGEDLYGRVAPAPVKAGSVTVAEWTNKGVVGVPRPLAGTICRGTVDGNNRPQALWLFSTDACGVYGYTTVQIEHAGRTTPAGNIVLISSDGKLNINSGSGFLLRVQGS